jgi:hypothetical protein
MSQFVQLNRTHQPPRLIPTDPQDPRGPAYIALAQHVDGEALEHSLNRDRGSAHGTLTCTIPCSRHSTRGIRACR